MPLSAALELERVSLKRGGRTVLHDIAMQIPSGRVAALLGPNGCGKTTLLRVIAGLEQPAAGVIRIDGDIKDDERRHCAPEKRRTALVFQDLALFPNCTVAGHIRFGLGRNIRFGLGRNIPFGLGRNRSDATRQLRKLLELTSLTGLEKRYPHQLSGGQRQRVALARALASKPRLMLLDEPFANLDNALRTALADETMAILREAGITTLMVTHDLDEACSLADQINLMRDGRLLQTTPPDWFRKRPYSASLAGLGGYQGFVQGTLGADGRVKTPLGELHAALPGVGTAGTTVTLMVGCEDLRLDEDGDLSGMVTCRNFHAGKVVYTVSIRDAGRMYCLGGMDSLRNIGETVQISADLRPLAVTRDV